LEYDNLRELEGFQIANIVHMLPEEHLVVTWTRSGDQQVAKVSNSA
jgi:hypothetical protein